MAGRGRRPNREQRPGGGGAGPARRPNQRPGPGGASIPQQPGGGGASGAGGAGAEVFGPNQGNGGRWGNAAQAVWALMAHGWSRPQAQEWVQSLGWTTAEQVNEWWATWGSADWSQPATPAPTDPTAPPAPADPTAPPGEEDTGPSPQEIEALRTMLSDLGMLEFADAYLKYLTMGYPAEDFATISNLVQADPEYKRMWDERFAGNVGRDPNLGSLSPARYIELERSYAQRLRDSGLPAGFYDNRAAWADWIRNDVSPEEVQRRIGWASQALDDSSNAPLLAALQAYYGVTRADAMAWILDPQKAEENVLTRKWANVQAGAAANRAGIGVSLDVAGELAGKYGQIDPTTGDFSFGESWVDQSLQQAAQSAGGWKGLDSTWGDSTLSNDDLVRGAAGLEGGTAVEDRKRKLASQERAAFGGSTGLGRGSLAKRRGD